jgi:CRISPR-associated protein Cmx8
MTPTATAQETLTLHYSLPDLPTAQHKAGLAGLLLLIDTLHKKQIGPLPELLARTPLSVTLQFSHASLQTLFRQLYAACEVESSSKQVRKDKNKQVLEPLRIEERPSADGKKSEKVYIYLDLRPAGGFFRDYFPGGAESPWLKLWQDMLWSTLRGIPATRGLYEEQLAGQPCSEANRLWLALLKASKPKYAQLTLPVASSVYVGAQDVNAEQVPFQGRPAENLLLHFWNLVSLIYVPQRLQVEDGRIKSEYAGFVLAIPEVAHLERFAHAYLKVIQNLAPEKAGYRPRASLIHLPEEGAMEYLYHLAHSGFLENTGKDLRRVIHAIELHHLEKQGNNIRSLSADRVIPQSRWFKSYENIRTTFQNPLFKRIRLRNLLKGAPWYQGVQDLFSHYSWKLFSHDSTRPQYAFFGRDVRRSFESLIEDLNKKEKAHYPMTEQSEELLARSLYRLIRGYAQFRSEQKSGLRYEQFRAQLPEQGYPSKYREAREKVCQEAFLAMRGRREADFIEYFSGTICAVPHYLPEDDFIRVSQALLTDWETVKTLSMLALSAHSYLSQPKHEQGEPV